MLVGTILLVLALFPCTRSASEPPTATAHRDAARREHRDARESRRSTDDSAAHPIEVASEGSGVWRARLVDGVTGSAVPAGLVYVPGDGGPRPLRDVEHARSDADGRVSLRVSAPATIAVLAPGFVPVTHRIERLQSGDDLVELALSPGLAVSGVVRSSDGGPLAGVRVWATGGGIAGAARFRDAFALAGDQLGNCGFADTDASGRFEIRGFVEGELTLRATRVGWRPRGVTRSVQSTESVPVLGPETTTVRAGRAGVVIEMEPIWTLAVIAVDDETGEVLEAASIAQVGDVVRASGRWTPVQGPEDDWFRGTERFLLARRAYYRDPGAATSEDTLPRILVQSPGYEPVETTLRPKPPTDPDYLEPREIRLRPRAEASALDLRIELAGRPVGGSFLLQVMESGSRGVSVVTLGEPDGDGFRHLPLPAGVYSVSGRGHPLVPTLDGRPIEVTLEGGKTARAVLSLDAGLASVRVEGPDGRGLETARLRITSTERFARSWLVTRSNSALVRDPDWAATLDSHEAGRFRAFLRPGPYRLTARCAGFENGQVESFFVESGSETEVVVRLPAIR